MDCAGVGEHLVSYHLANASEEEREAVERHLVDCNACLRTYLALKRAADRAGLERPSPEVRSRLRASVAEAFPRSRGSRTVFARKIPLYQGFALAAIAAAIALFAPSVAHRVLRAPTAGTPAIDTSRTHAESLHIY
jgi:anti-sigma factor RsiW